MFDEAKKERIIKEATFIVRYSATIRKTAQQFGISKTVIHQDVTEHLKYIDKNLYKQVRIVLDYNASQRAIRGGIATREKYKNNPKSSR